MRKQLLVGAAAAIIAAAATGASYALFDSERSTTPSQTSAGDLEIELRTGNDSGSLISWRPIGPLKPHVNGEGSIESYNVLIKNTGSVDASVYYGAADIVNGEGSCLSPEESIEGSGCTPEGELSQQLNVSVTQMQVVGGKCGDPIPSTTTTVTLDAMDDPEHPQGGADLPITHGGSVCLKFGFFLPDTADNRVQSDTVDFKMNFILKSN